MGRLMHESIIDNSQCEWNKYLYSLYISKIFYSQKMPNLCDKLYYYYFIFRDKCVFGWLNNNLQKSYILEIEKYRMWKLMDSNKIVGTQIKV